MPASRWRNRPNFSLQLLCASFYLPEPPCTSFQGAPSHPLTAYMLVAIVSVVRVSSSLCPFSRLVYDLLLRQSLGWGYQPDGALPAGHPESQSRKHPESWSTWRSVTFPKVLCGQLGVHNLVQCVCFTYTKFVTAVNDWVFATQERKKERCPRLKMKGLSCCHGWLHP